MKAVNYLFFTILCVVGIYTIQSCKKNRFKKSTFLESLFDFKIAPEIANARLQMGQLVADWEAYSTGMAPTNLTKTKSDFLVLMDQMEALNFYNLGDVGATYVFNRSYKTKIDTSAIFELYAAQTSFDESNIAGYTNSERGLFALEYLLFSPQHQDSLVELKYVDFIDAQLNFMNTALADFQNSWSIYRENFIEHVDDDVTDSYNIVVNRIIVVLEDLIEKRIAAPVDHNEPAEGVGFYANQSLRNIKSQVIQVRQIYMGQGTEDFNSIYNSIHKSYKELADRVLDKFDETIAYGEIMHEELGYYITDDQATLTAYKNLLIELLTLFKIDVQQELDIVITFSGSDGD